MGNYILEGVKSQDSQMISYLRFCLVFGHEPVVNGKGVSDRVLSHYIIWLAASGIQSLRQYVSGGPRLVCEQANDKWKSLHKRIEYKRTLMSLERLFAIPPKRKKPVTCV